MKQLVILSLGLLLLFNIGGWCEEKKVSEDEMMKKWMAYATPGAEHKVLETHVGEWNIVTKAWMAPKTPPQVSKGTAKAKMILGGRYLHMKYKGNMMGQPFEGYAVSGFDNHKKKYTSLWIDNMSTGFFFSNGTMCPKTKTLKDTAKHDNVMTGGITTYRTETTFDKADTFTMTMYQKDEGQKEFKSMEITYTRKK